MPGTETRLPISIIERGQNEVANIGAAAENVYITLSVDGQQEYITLADFATYLYNYFENGVFLNYGKNQVPVNANLNTKVWYDTNNS